MKRQNKLGAYLAVTAGVGCAVSVADGAIVVIDLSGVSAVPGEINFPSGSGNVTGLYQYSSSMYGFLSTKNGSARFYGDYFTPVIGNGAWAGGYQGTDVVAFPTDSDSDAVWFSSANGDISMFGLGLNWVAFKDNDNNFGWFSVSLDAIAVNDEGPISSFGHFVYDDASSSPGTAISLATAVAAVPEPSSLALLALGAAGLISRRQRKAA